MIGKEEKQQKQHSIIFCGNFVTSGNEWNGPQENIQNLEHLGKKATEIGFENKWKLERNIFRRYYDK